MQTYKELIICISLKFISDTIVTWIFNQTYYIFQVVVSLLVRSYLRDL
jgi:hypothetical protein